MQFLYLLVFGGKLFVTICSQISDFVFHSSNNVNIIFVAICRRLAIFLVVIWWQSLCYFIAYNPF
ncbi:hypothetical protein Lpp22_2045 [Lacticaseibacillus paracasei subsp. paracasei Lpp22]|uniref:Uncharacterized protein n=1 Tax=Lacticaseibacillus paracasei subsp. paracasei Lpp22 TaxID=1256221 RepID=A0A8E0M5P9_LACPA|nr:hypothetical protein Lpp22_2045 [Lacticaseibacillus paracasei subsp. paracasei Lpp22]